MFDAKTIARRAFMAAAWHSGLVRIADSFMGGEGAILMLHRVGGPRNRCGINHHLSVGPDFLSEVIVDLRASGYEFVSMDEAVARTAAPVRGNRFVTITLDDGYIDNIRNAVPIFRRLETPYTIYIAPGLVDGVADVWWELLENIIVENDLLRLPLAAGGHRDIPCASPEQKRAAYCEAVDELTQRFDEDGQRAAIAWLARRHDIDRAAYARDNIMGWELLRTLSRDQLCTIGAHTVHHYALRRLPERRARAEITDSVDQIAEQLGARPVHFAYPYGHGEAVSEREVAMVRDLGFRSAVTTRHGLVMKGHSGSLHALPRISLNGLYADLRYVRTMLSGITVPVANGGRRVVTI